MVEVTALKAKGEIPLCDGREIIVEMDLYFSIRKASYVPICINRM